MEQEPIYIGGLAHSGKTLLRRMLSAQPNLVISRKTNIWDRFYNRFGDLSRPQNFERCLAAILQNKQVQSLAPDEARIRAEFWQGTPSYARLFALIQEHHAERLGKTRWGVQLGFAERLADPIFAAFPDAKMIHMIRDPRDRNTAVKSITQHRRGKTGWSTACWLYSVGLARRNQKRYPDNYLLVRYESLITQPEETLRQICDFLGESFVPEMVAMIGEEDTAVSPTAPSLAKQEIAFTQSVARRYMLAFGYRLTKPQLSPRDWVQFYLLDWPANLATLVFWSVFKARSIGKYVRS
jgi:hypothetical protein